MNQAREKSDGELLGERLRQIRIASGLTLTEVARQAEISKSLLSQVERGSSNASIGVLRSVARVLGVPFFRLFVETDPEKFLVRRGERRQLQVPGSHMRRELLVPDLQRRMVLVMAKLEPGEVSSPDFPAQHSGDECVLVLSGCIEVDVNGNLLVLEEGDCLYFDANVPHNMKNIHDGPSEVLAVLSNE